MKNKSRLSLKARSSITGIMFVLPFTLGMLFFFFAPIAQSIRFMFSDVRVESTGFEAVFTGVENLHYIFRVDLKFSQNLTASILQTLWKVPVIIIASLFIAMIINSEFTGRTVVRAIFFMPVIVMSGVIMDVIKLDMIAANTMGGSVVSVNSVIKSNALNDLLVSSGMSRGLVQFFTMIADNVFDVLYSGGIQMLMFLAALQSISPSLYEAASIEGATAWESFWKITVPMLLPFMLINIVYTIVDCFTASSNLVMKQVMASVELIQMGRAAAMTWVYCGIVLALLGIVFFLFSRSKAYSTEY